MLNALKKSIKALLKPTIKVRLERIPGKLEKLGTQYGGWTIPVGFLNRNSVCYLAGAGEDISFDVALANRFHSDIYIFDPTPRASEHFEKVINAARHGWKMQPTGAANYNYELSKPAINCLQFHATGIWKKNDVLRFFAPKDATHVSHSISNLQQTDHYFEATVQRLSYIMRQNGHRQLDILKLDIEGAEYEVLDTIIADHLAIKVLCVEFHPSKERGLEPVREAIKKLEQNNFKVIVKEDLDFTFINTGLYKSGAF